VRRPYKKLGCAFGVGGDGKRKSGEQPVWGCIQYGWAVWVSGPRGVAALGWYHQQVMRKNLRSLGQHRTQLRPAGSALHPRHALQLHKRIRWHVCGACAGLPGVVPTRNPPVSPSCFISNFRSAFVFANAHATTSCCLSLMIQLGRALQQNAMRRLLRCSSDVPDYTLIYTTSDAYSDPSSLRRLCIHF